MLPTTFRLGLFSIGTATDNHAASISLIRFRRVVFGSAPLRTVSLRWRLYMNRVRSETSVVNMLTKYSTPTCFKPEVAYRGSR